MVHCDWLVLQLTLIIFDMDVSLNKPRQLDPATEEGAVFEAVALVLSITKEKPAEDLLFAIPIMLCAWYLPRVVNDFLYYLFLCSCFR